MQARFGAVNRGMSPGTVATSLCGRRAGPAPGASRPRSSIRCDLDRHALGAGCGEQSTKSGRMPSCDRAPGGSARRPPASATRVPLHLRLARRRRAAGSRFMPGRADEVADEGVRGPLEQLGRRADLHAPGRVHHHHLVGEGQRLGLVVGHVDHRQVERRGGSPSASTAAAISGAGRSPSAARRTGPPRRPRAPGRGRARSSAWRRPTGCGRGGRARRSGPAWRRSRATRAFDSGPRHAAVAQREGQVLAPPSWCRRSPGTGTPGRCCAARRQRGDVRAVEQQPPRARVHQAGDDVEQRRLAAAARARAARRRRRAPTTMIQRPQRVVASAAAAGRRRGRCRRGRCGPSGRRLAGRGTPDRSRPSASNTQHVRRVEMEPRPAAPGAQVVHAAHQRHQRCRPDVDVDEGLGAGDLGHRTAPAARRRPAPRRSWRRGRRARSASGSRQTGAAARRRRRGEPPGLGGGGLSSSADR